MRKLVSGLLLVALVLLVGNPGLAADAPTGPQPVSGKIRVAYVASSSYGPLFLAAHKYWPALGIEVEMVRQSSGGGVLSQIATGQAQVGAGTMGGAYFNAVYQGLPVIAVASSHFDSGEDYLLLSNAWKERGVTSAADLKGRPVAINGRGIAIEFLLQIALNNAGLSVRDVELVTMPFPDMVRALETGAVAGATVSQPFNAQALQQNVAYRAYPEADYEVQPVTILFYNNNWAKQNPELATAVMVGYLQATREIIDLGKHDGDYLDALVEYTGALTEVLQSYLPSYYDPNGELRPEDFDAQQLYNMDMGHVEYTDLLPYELMVDNTWLLEAYKQIGRR